VLTDRFTRLRTIVRDAARAQSLDELGKLEDELSAMFDELVERLARGGLDESEISTALLIFKHVSDALGERRRALAGSAMAAVPAAVSAETRA
jgi:hypothetical protein